MFPTIDSASNNMHQYKVHLPKQSTWDCDYEEWLDRSYVNGVNRDIKQEIDEDLINPSSLEDIPLDISGSFN